MKFRVGPNSPFQFWLSPDGDPGGDGAPAGNPTPPGGGNNPDPAVPPANSPEGGTPPKLFTQEEVNKFLATRLSEQRQSFDKKAADELAKKEAEEAVKRGEFEKLYKETLGQVDALKPLEERVTKLTSYVDRLIDTDIANWPVEVKASDPGPNSGESRIQWVEQMKPLALRLIEASKAPSPEGGNPGGKKEAVDAAAKVVNSRRYNIPGVKPSGQS